MQRINLKSELLQDGDDVYNALMSVHRENGLDVEDLGDTPPPLIRQGSSIRTNEDVISVPNIIVRINCSNEPEKFVTEEQKRGIKHTPSQQWRLLRVNQNLPEATESFPNSETQVEHGDKLNQRKWKNRNKSQCGKTTKMFGNINPNFRRIIQRKYIEKSGELRTLITPPPSCRTYDRGVGNIPRGGIPQLQQPQLVTFANILSRIGQASSCQDREGYSAVIGNVMRDHQQQQQGRMIMPIVNQQTICQMNSNEVMPFAVRTLLNHITVVQQNFGPKYDINAQKEIHTLQGKSMYRRVGVVSTDGQGIEHEPVVPKTTALHEH
ncbi:uncharacterized protein LOC129779823 isoform X2 [Toxorhynchites rutilus septentrionalis]|uniref:uncharacterized protein LOC129779823 isoform X2 n=1 Tax=Toxorhynchites rutilus septentrionalis TaxID=329112 RepID=UPI00247AB281|nr:uncharacterized protein LOC129779823 isoform X2 [Toxorhynchites rutilus septentrionalis]